VSIGFGELRRHLAYPLASSSVTSSATPCNQYPILTIRGLNKRESTLKFYILREDSFHDFRLTRTSKWRFFEKHHIKDNSCCPQIAFFIIFFAENLRSDIVGSPNTISENFVGFLLHCNSEVNELDRASFLFEQNIFWFNITMNDVLRVNIDKGL
jgi:hypothetical protein